MKKKFLLVFIIIVSVFFVFGCRQKQEVEIPEVPRNGEVEAVVDEKDGIEEQDSVDEAPDEFDKDEEISPMELLAIGVVNEFDFQIGDNINDVIEQWGQPVAEPFYWAGGEWYSYGDLTFITWIEDPIIRHIGFESSTIIYGIEIGDSIDRIKSIMGNNPESYTVNDPDNDFDDELAIFKEDKQVLSYGSGDYSISFYCDDTKLIHGYIFYKGD
ncbi:MAG: hypothetical protein M0P77_03490 [Firmicutes bacterium]|nr:hypothetical protein [Bacillota bacterium]